MKKIYITEEQLEEIIDDALNFGDSTTSEYSASTVSTTEPVAGEHYGDPMTSDDRANEMPPGIYQRMLSRGRYSGPSI